MYGISCFIPPQKMSGSNVATVDGHRLQKQAKPFIISVASVFNEILQLTARGAVKSSEEQLKRLNNNFVHQLVDAARLASVGLQSLCKGI
jgi:uncharacterized membrane protein YqiK